MSQVAIYKCKNPETTPQMLLEHVEAITDSLMSPALATADVPDSEQVSKLLSEAKTQAFQLREDASTMESYTRSNASWQSHSAAVDQMKEHINAAGRTLTKLEDARHTASPWQATAMDRVKPLLKEIAPIPKPLSSYINKNPKRLFMNEYKDHRNRSEEHTSELQSLRHL